MNYRLRFVILKADAIKSQKVAKKGSQKSRTSLSVLCKLNVAEYTENVEAIM